MTVQEKQELYLAFIKEEGYNCEITGSGNIQIEYKGAYLYIYIDKTDENYFLMSFPTFWKVNTSQERARALFIGNILNCKYKVAKIVVTGENSNIDVSIDMGMYLKDVTDFKLFFAKMCDALLTMAKEFIVEIKKG